MAEKYFMHREDEQAKADRRYRQCELSGRLYVSVCYFQTYADVEWDAATLTQGGFEIPIEQRNKVDDDLNSKLHELDHRINAVVYGNLDLGQAIGLLWRKAEEYAAYVYDTLMMLELERSETQGGMS